MAGEFITDPGSGVQYFVDDVGDWYVPDAFGNYQPVSAPGASNANDWATILAQTAQAVATGYMTIQQQKAYLAENTRRAQQNLPLLSPQQWGTLGTVQVSADAQTRNLMIAAAVGLGALALFSLSRRR